MKGGAELAGSFTDPLKSDSDIDGIPDGWEVEFGLNPLLDDTDWDSDNDGKTNIEEYMEMTHPRDTDDDGIADSQDNCFLSNPLQENENDNGIGDGCDCLPTPIEGCLNPESMLSLVDALTANNADDNGLGSVDYPFGIATTEVTNAEYVLFLEAVAAIEDPDGLYNPSMGTSPQGGIERLGEAGEYHYRLRLNMADKPVNFVSWLDSARYVNWLENGRPSGEQSPATTETGSFDLTVPDAAVQAQFDPDARWSLPTEDEWYKAAYFEPPARYYLYPTSADIQPIPIVPDGLGNGMSGNVNYFDGTASEPIGVVSVGTGEAGSDSFSGTSDQGGNVSEWLAIDAEEGLRIARGGSFRDDHLAFLSFPSADRVTMRFDPNLEVDDVGFRVVLIPEPALGRCRSRRSHRCLPYEPVCAGGDLKSSAGKAPDLDSRRLSCSGVCGIKFGNSRR